MVRLEIKWYLAIDLIKTILVKSVVFLSYRVKMVGNEEVTKSKTSPATPPAPSTPPIITMYIIIYDCQ